MNEREIIHLPGQEHPVPVGYKGERKMVHLPLCWGGEQLGLKWRTATYPKIANCEECLRVLESWS